MKGLALWLRNRRIAACRRHADRWEQHAFLLMARSISINMLADRLETERDALIARETAR